MRNLFVYITRLLRTELEGMRVRTKGGRKGRITKFYDLHNVHVKYRNGGSGIHCLIPGCTEYEDAVVKGKKGKLTKPHYDPLFID